MTVAVSSKMNAPWWLVLVQGISLSIIGILLLTSPAMTVATIVLFVGVYWLVDGVFSLVRIFLRSSEVHWGWLLVRGILGILAGGYIISNPLLSTLMVPATLALIMGIQGIIMGVAGLVEAFKGGGRGAGLLGAINIFLGFVLVFKPDDSRFHFAVGVGDFRPGFWHHHYYCLVQDAERRIIWLPDFDGRLPMTVAPTQPDPPGGGIPGTLRLARQALLLQETVYEPLLDAPRPFRRGLGIISVILLTVALAYAVGVVINLLTMPRVDLVQQDIYNAVTGSAWYEGQVALRPNFAGFFDFMYGLTWQILQIVGVYPSWLGAVFAFFSVVVLVGILNWLGYGVLAYMVARWLGGDLSKSRFLAVLSISYAPTLLLIANIIPGLTVPASLIGLWTLITNYQAIRVAFKLSWVRSALITVLPYVLAFIFFYIAIYGVIYLGFFVYGLIG